MTTKKMTTSWMWPTGDGINGLEINAVKKTLHWYDDFGCACDSACANQTLADYLNKGLPACITLVPDDVSAEIAQTLKQLQVSDPT